ARERPANDLRPCGSSADADVIGLHTDPSHLGDAGNIDDIVGGSVVSEGRIEVSAAGQDLAAVRGQGVDRFFKRPRLEIQVSRSPGSEQPEQPFGQRLAVNSYTSDTCLYRTGGVIGEVCDQESETISRRTTGQSSFFLRG